MSPRRDKPAVSFSSRFNAPLAPTPPDTVRVYHFPLDAPAPTVSRFWATLSETERERAGRFLQVEHRRRFAVAHGMLRRVLALETDAAPGDIELAAADGGKPFVTAPEAAPAFSLSHTGGHGAVAICRAAPIGVDIEAERAVHPGLARRYFAPDEADWLEGLPEAARESAFFRIWTLKEAFVKATGEGIRRGLETFSVRVEGEVARLIMLDDSPALASRWRVFSFEITSGLWGAVALDRVQFRLNHDLASFAHGPHRPPAGPCAGAPQSGGPRSRPWSASIKQQRALDKDRAPRLELVALSAESEGG